MSNSAMENHVNNNNTSNCVSPTSTQSAVVSGRTSPTSLMSPQQLLNGPGLKQQSHLQQSQQQADLSNDSMSTLKTIAQEVVNRTNVNMMQTPPLNMVQQQSQQLQQQQQQQSYVMDGSSIDTSSAVTGQNGLNQNANINNMIQATNMSNVTNMKSSGTNEALIPPLLGVAPLGPSPLQKDHQLQVTTLMNKNLIHLSLTNFISFFKFQMMESAYYHLPSPSDSERIRCYLQRQPIQTATYYPQVCEIEPLNWMVYLSQCLFVDSTSTFRHNRVLSTFSYRNALLRFLLHGRNKGAVSCGESLEKAKLEVPHQVHDVVSTSWRAESYQWGVRTGLCLKTAWKF